MAFVAYYGHTSPAEFAAMDPKETKRFAAQLTRIQAGERELQITLGKVSAGLKLSAREEVR